MADEVASQAPAPAPPAAPAPRRGGAFSRFLTWLIVLGLLAAVWWLASERNARRFTLEARDNALVVGRGRFFPFGARALGPEDGELGKLYAPFPLPAGAKGRQGGEYADQTQLDRAIFSDAVASARQAAQKADAAGLAQAETLAGRVSQLPGLSPSQLDELATLRGELALTAARGEASSALRLVRAARARLEAARRIGGERLGQVEALSSALDDAARTLEQVAQGSVREGKPAGPPAQDAPSQAPQPSSTEPQLPGSAGTQAPAEGTAAPERPEAGSAPAGGASPRPR